MIPTHGSSQVLSSFAYVITGFLAPSVSRLVKEAADIEDAYGVKPHAQFTCGVGDSREQLRQIQEPVAFPQLVSDLDNLVTELLAKGE